MESDKRNDLTCRRAMLPRSGRAAQAAASALAAAVFAFLDLVDALLCLVYALLDGLLEDTPVGCYCHRTYDVAAAEAEVSDTLYVRRSLLRHALAWLLRPAARTRAGAPEERESGKWRSPRWSDCGCATCGAWRGNGGRLHIVTKEPEPAGTHSTSSSVDNGDAAIFIHGFVSSSSFWAETVFPVLDGARRVFAVDLLGFGRSPKPANCMYGLKDHVDAIEQSLIEPQNISSFHLVSHSMGCIVALALAARHPTRVKSITLFAPPCLPPGEQPESQAALRMLVGKKLWPPLLFGSAVMSWYEHIGRTVCFFVCKNHRVWECLLQLLTGKGDVDFRVRDLTRHTHHSAWHTMHNVVCGGAALQERSLEAVAGAGVPVKVVHGAGDRVVPAECARHLKARLPRAELHVMAGCDHATVVLGRERDVARELTAFWSRSSS